MTTKYEIMKMILEDTVIEYDELIYLCQHLHIGCEFEAPFLIMHFPEGILKEMF